MNFAFFILSEEVRWSNEKRKGGASERGIIQVASKFRRDLMAPTLVRCPRWDLQLAFTLPRHLAKLGPQIKIREAGVLKQDIK